VTVREIEKLYFCLIFGKDEMNELFSISLNNEERYNRVIILIASRGD